MVVANTAVTSMALITLGGKLRGIGSKRRPINKHTTPTRRICTPVMATGL
jgi:hypothetical protein